jgi:hypothetical protein
MRIPLPRPRHSSALHIRQIRRPQPVNPLLRKLAPLNLPRQLIRPLLGLRKRPPPPHPAHKLLRNTRIPHMMQIHLPPIKQHMNPIPTPLHILRVQRLVHVTNKMHDKLGRDGALRRVQARVEQARRVVGQRRDDAAALVLLAVALELDAAVRRRVVLGVDEVEVLGEAAPFCVAHRVGPGRDPGEVLARVVAEEGLEVGGGLGRDEVAGEVGDTDVSEACRRGGANWVLVSLPSGIDMTIRRWRWLRTAPCHCTGHGCRADGEGGELHVGWCRVASWGGWCVARSSLTTVYRTYIQQAARTQTNNGTIRSKHAVVLGRLAGESQPPCAAGMVVSAP